MARNGVKTGGRNFVKGVVTNPKGRPKTPEYLKVARKMNKVKFEEILQKYTHCTTSELKAALKHDDTPVLELAVIKILHESILKGDQKRLEFVLDRLIGKVKNEIDVTTKGESLNGEVDLSKLSDSELAKMQALMEKCQSDTTED